MGAWIEIVRAGKSKKKNASLLSWERGLKFLDDTKDEALSE